ncbi:hypothetical protein DFQ28_000214 [Apophysomyces sp. BC1034]|nr:hypothetical protein DFQ28_000214 [Apophysomyces sp. BC1034]
MPPPAKPTTPRSYKDICDDITYRPNEMNLNESPEVASDKPKKHSPEATKNEKNPLRETHLGARVSVPNVLYTGVRCAGCDKAISGMTITAAGQVWHAGCFKCQHCKQDLEHVAFYTKDGRPYCALDYHELFSTRCDYCGTPIEEKSIQALGKYYHEGHFFCRECGKPFDETDAFMVHDGHPYCEVDYLAKFGHKCMGCGEYITGEVVSALDEFDQLGGQDCGKEFTSATFYVRNNRPFCEEHYRAVQHPSTTPKLETVADRKTCHRCGDAIEGRSASAFGKEYHTTHFQCALCDKVLSECGRKESLDKWCVYHVRE